MAKLFEYHLGEYIYPDEYNNIIHRDEYKDIYDELLLFAKRGDLIINLDIPDYRNYNVAIINIQNNTLKIEELDDYECYNGFPRVPIKYLDILIKNTKYWETYLSLFDSELEQYSINDVIELEPINYYHIDKILDYNVLSIIINKDLPYSLYTNIYNYLDNPLYYRIENTNCIIKDNSKYNKRKIKNLIYNGIKYNAKLLLNYEIIDNDLLLFI